MKDYLQFVATALAFSLLGAPNRSQAQPGALSAHYSVRFVNQTYSQLTGSEVLPSVDGSIQFLNSFRSIDMDDGTADSIPVGFTFDYNGILSNTINVNINGWVSVNPIGTVNSIPFIPSNNNSIFTSTLPNNVLAPYWGDHFYRTAEPGFESSRISYLTEFLPDSTVDTNGLPFTRFGVFILEWRNLNINDKSNPNSIASFQLYIYQNLMAWDRIAPDQRATIEFRYGMADSSSIVSGDAVGINDSAGSSFLNGLFPSSQFNGDSTRLSTTRTACWPPTFCTPGIAIQFVPISSTASVKNSSGPNNLSIYPNPFTQSTTIRFTSTESGPAQVTILNLLGEEVARVYDGELPTGEHSFIWNARDASPGTYEAIMRGNGHVDRIPIQLLR